MMVYRIDESFGIQLSLGTKIIKFTQLSLCYSMITNHELSKKGALWTVCLQIQVFLQVSCFSFYCRSRYRCFRTGAKSIWSCAGATTNASIVYLLKYILEHRTCADTSVCYMHLRSVQKAFFHLSNQLGCCIKRQVHPAKGDVKYYSSVASRHLAARFKMLQNGAFVKVSHFSSRFSDFHVNSGFWYFYRNGDFLAI